MISNKNKKLKRKSSKKSIITALLALAILFIGFGIYYKQVKDHRNNSRVQQGATEAVDYEGAKQEEDDTTGSFPDPLKNPADTEPDVLTGNVSIGQPTFEQSSGVITSTVSISGASSGMCRYVFSTPDDKPVLREVGMTSGSCSVSIPEVEFATLGEWTLSISFGGQSIGRKVSIN